MQELRRQYPVFTRLLIVRNEITMIIHWTSDQYLYLRLVHCQTNNSSNGRPRKTPWVKSYAGNKATIILLLKSWQSVRNEMTMVIPRTSPKYLYLRLVHCMTSNSSNGRPLKTPWVKSYAGNKATISCFYEVADGSKWNYYGNTLNLCSILISAVSALYNK